MGSEENELLVVVVVVLFLLLSCSQWGGGKKQLLTVKSGRHIYSEFELMGKAIKATVQGHLIIRKFLTNYS